MAAEANNSGFFHLPAGFCFSPTPSQILTFYLGPKISGALPPEVESVIPTVDLFTSDAPPPSSLHPAASRIPNYPYDSVAAPKDVRDWFYCFTRVTPRGSGFCRATLRGTWVANGRDRPIRKGGRILGHKTALAFRAPDAGGKSTVNTGWVMTEFRLHHGGDAAKGEMLVLCTIRCINRVRKTTGEEASTVPLRKRQRTVLPADPRLDVRPIAPEEELSDSSAVTTAVATPLQAVHGSGSCSDLVGAISSEAPCSLTEEVLLLLPPAVEEDDDASSGHPAKATAEEGAIGVAPDRASSGPSDATSQSGTHRPPVAEELREIWDWGWDWEGVGMDSLGHPPQLSERAIWEGMGVDLDALYSIPAAVF